jgi:hypothetical protein
MRPQGGLCASYDSQILPCFKSVQFQRFVVRGEYLWMILVPHAILHVWFNNYFINYLVLASAGDKQQQVGGQDWPRAEAG